MAQWNKNTQDFLNQERSLFEVFQIADHWGEQTDWRPNFTTANRLKTSPYETIFFDTFQYSKEDDVWADGITGNATCAHNPNESNVVMEVGGAAGDKIIRQTKRVMRYTPGRSSLLAFAIRLDTPDPGVRRRFGLFDENNGVYFEDNGGIYSCVIRSSTSGSVVENRVVRDDWNGDKLDGNGYSQIIADSTKQQLVLFDYEWYGAGQVKVRWAIDGEIHTIHTFNHANRIENVWCQTPFLPIRCELENVTGETAGPHYLYQGSNSLSQEGASEIAGVLVSQQNPISGTSLGGQGSQGTFFPVISVKLKDDQLGGIIIPQSLQAAISGQGEDIYWKLVENATLTGASFVDHENPDSFTQIDTSATALTGGRTIIAGFEVAGSSTLIPIDGKSYLSLGRSGIGTNLTSDTYTLACAANQPNLSALGVLNWIEQR